MRRANLKRVRWEPFREMDNFFLAWSLFIERALRRLSGDETEWSATANISEANKEYPIKPELPHGWANDFSLPLTEN